MYNKMLFNFKNETYAKLMLAYIGARTIQPTITKTSILSALIDTSTVDLPCTVTGKTGTILTFSQLYKKGIDTINNALSEVLNIKKDYRFLSYFNTIEIGEQINSEETGLAIVRKIMSDTLLNKITTSDLDAIVNLIYPTGPYIDGDEENPYIRIFKESQKEYWVFPKIESIINRYIKIKDSYEYYTILTDFILAEFNTHTFNNRYEFVTEGNELNNHLDSDEFNKEFFNYLHISYSPDRELYTPIANRFTSEQFRFLQSYSIELIRFNDAISYEHFNFRADLYYLIIDDLRELLSIILSLNFKTHLKSTVYNAIESILYKKHFIERFNLKRDNNKYDYDRVIKVRKYFRERE